MSTAELLKDQDTPEEAESSSLPEIALPGISSHVQTVIGTLIHNGGISIATDFRYKKEQGQHMHFNSVEELNATIDTLKKEKDGKARIEIISSELKKITMNVIGES
jgi:hypothetical protein